MTILHQIEMIDPSSVLFPLDGITEHQEIAGVADDYTKQIWGFLQQIRREFAKNPSARTKAMVQITELYLIDVLKQQFPAGKGQQVVGIGYNGQIYWAKYSVFSSDLLNRRLNAGSAFFMHRAA